MRRPLLYSTSVPPSLALATAYSLDCSVAACYERIKINNNKNIDLHGTL